MIIAIAVHPRPSIHVAAGMYAIAWVFIASTTGCSNLLVYYSPKSLEAQTLQNMSDLQLLPVHLSSSPRSSKYKFPSSLVN